MIAGDPAEGGDNSTFVAISKNKSDVVMISVSKEESSQLGYTLSHIGKWFEKQTGNYPCIAVEKNTGAATIFVLKQLNYPNLFKMPSSFTASDMQTGDQFGWVTSSATRPKMLDDLALAIRQQAVKIPSKPVIDELYSFVRNEKTGKPQADVGAHDDLVIALAIAWQLYQIAPTFSQEEYYDINKDLAKKWRIE